MNTFNTKQSYCISLFFLSQRKQMNQEKGIVQNKTKSQKQLLDQKEYSSIGDFQVLKKIGEGTYASVYKVRRLADDQIYALKKIKLDLMGKRDQDNALNQVRLLASINHQNIIGFKETFYEKGCLFIVLQYADNGDLMHEVLQRRKQNQHLSQIDIWQILLQIILALHNLHSQNIIHRDIKPANIFLTKQGVAKLGDLNVSKIVNKFCQTQTGTPYYASPQIWKDQPYNKKSDIWSLGCTIYQIASLYPPFLGEDLQAIYKQITQENYPPLPIFYSPQLHKILKRMLEKEPKKRISTDYILKNIEKIVPEVFRSLAIVQKIKCQFDRSQHRHTTSVASLLKTIVFPNSKLRKNNQFQVNSYLPSPSYTRESSLYQSINTKDQNASVTLNQGSILKKVKDNKLKHSSKGVSLYVNSESKQNKNKILHRQESKLIKRNKQYKLPLIKKSNMKR